MKLTPAQERELVAWFKWGMRPRPMTITKYRRMHLMGDNDRLNEEGRSLAMALGHEQDAARQALRDQDASTTTGSNEP